MNYKINPSYVLVKICDTNLLVAKREKWEENPVVQPVPPIHALFWPMMDKGKTSEEVIQAFSKGFQKPREVIEKMFSGIVDNLADNGYLVPVEESDQ